MVIARESTRHREPGPLRPKEKRRTLADTAFRLKWWLDWKDQLFWSSFFFFFFLACCCTTTLVFFFLFTVTFFGPLL